MIGIRKFFDKKREKFLIKLNIHNKKNLICIEKILQDKNIRFENIASRKKISFFVFSKILNYLKILKFISKRIFLESSSDKVLDYKNYIVSYLAYIDKTDLSKDIVKTVYWGDIFKDNKKIFFYIFITKILKIISARLIKFKNQKVQIF